MSKKIISYGQTYDEFIEVDGLSDEIRFKLCMKLYKTHDSIELLEKAIKRKSLEIINNTL